MVIKTVVNADTGTADIVGGDDWDSIATWINNSTLQGKAYSYLITKSGSTVYVTNVNGTIAHSGSNVITEAQWAVDNLTVGRTWMEKIVIKGSFTGLTTELNLDSCTWLEVQGLLKPANSAAINIIRNRNRTAIEGSQDHDIMVTGGEYDGNKSGSTTGQAPLYFETVNKLTIRDCHSHDNPFDGICIAGCDDVDIFNCRLINNNAMGIRATGGFNVSIGAKDLRIRGCEATGNAINGFWVQGPSSTYKYFGASLIGNTTRSNINSGCYIDWNVFNWVVSGNVGEADTHAIFVNGQQNGTPYWGNGPGIVVGNTAYITAGNSIQLGWVRNVKVSNNIVNASAWHGIVGFPVQNCEFTNNTCLDNGTSIANTFSGLYLESSTGTDAVLYPVIDCTIKHNRCYDSNATVGSKNQKYGLNIVGTAYNNRIKGNNFNGNRTDFMSVTDFTDIVDNDGINIAMGRYDGVSSTGSTTGMFGGLVTAFGNTGGFGRLMDSGGVRMNYVTSATINLPSGAHTVTMSEMDVNPMIKFHVRLNSTVKTRMAAGLRSAPAPATSLADMLANFSGFFFCHDPDQNTGKFFVLTNNGGASSTLTDTGVAGDALGHTVTMFAVGTTRVMVILDRVLVANITATLPAAGTDIGPMWYIENTEAVAKGTEFWWVELRNHVA